MSVEEIVCKERGLTVIEHAYGYYVVHNERGEREMISETVINTWVAFYIKDQETAEQLLGKVVQFKGTIEPNKAALYLVVDESYNALSQGKVSTKTALQWRHDGLIEAVYTKDSK